MSILRKTKTNRKIKNNRKTKNNRKMKKFYGGQDDNMFINSKLKIDPNKKYNIIGVAHATALQGINALRGIGNDFANFFGQKGFDGSIYNIARNEAINTIIDKLTDKQKIKDIRFDIEMKGEQSILVHLTGTIIEEISNKTE